LELLNFVGIGKTADEYARNLSYGATTDAGAGRLPPSAPLT
jgi:hypothetical protein